MHQVMAGRDQYARNYTERHLRETIALMKMRESFLIQIVGIMSVLLIASIVLIWGR